jgi:hypothetical protein
MDFYDVKRKMQLEKMQIYFYSFMVNVFMVCHRGIDIGLSIFYIFWNAMHCIFIFFF